jgi:RNA polymerase sigma-70 factor (ECF subfamily)
MNLSCAEARAMVSDYLDGELEAPFAQALERHLTSCASCPPLYASLVSTLAELKTMGGPVSEVDDLVRKVTEAVKALGPTGAGR